MQTRLLALWQRKSLVVKSKFSFLKKLHITNVLSIYNKHVYFVTFTLNIFRFKGKGSSVTHLRVSIDFHLFSKVNFDRVGPELCPLLWGDERWLWALWKSPKHGWKYFAALKLRNQVQLFYGQHILEMEALETRRRLTKKELEKNKTKQSHNGQNKFLH